MNRTRAVAVAIAALFAGSAAPPPASYTVLVRGGTIYDGSGGAPYVGDVAIKGDRIVYVGPHAPGRAAKTIDASGKAVSPGFINMLSWANEDLIADPRGMSDTYQGVTLEVMGEGDSMGPWTPEMKRLELKRQGDIKFPIRWTTLGQYLDWITRKGITPNVTSFVGATTVRVHELGEKDVDPTPAQLNRMRALVRQAMKEGARRRRLLADLRAGDLCRDPGADRARARGRALRRNVHQPHARRGPEAARGDGRAGAHFPRVRSAGRNLPLQAGRHRQLGQDRRRHRQGEPGARARACGSPPTCTPMPQARPASTRPSRPGCRTAAWKPG